MSGVRQPVRRSSWLGPFPPSAPLTLQPRRCSPTSQVLRTHLTSRQRARPSCRLRRSRTAPGHEARRLTGSPGSRVWSVQTCSGSPTPPCRRFTRHDADRHVAFPLAPRGRHTGTLFSELDSPACLCLFPMLHPGCHQPQRTGQGRGEWLTLPRRTVSLRRHALTENLRSAGTLARRRLWSCAITSTSASSADAGGGI